jgi:hypothetical protein
MQQVFVISMKGDNYRVRVVQQCLLDMITTFQVTHPVFLSEILPVVDLGYHVSGNSGWRQLGALFGRA